jgi:hypothetical protein
MNEKIGCKTQKLVEKTSLGCSYFALEIFLFFPSSALDAPIIAKTGHSRPLMGGIWPLKGLLCVLDSL